MTRTSATRQILTWRRAHRASLTLVLALGLAAAAQAQSPLKAITAAVRPQPAAAQATAPAAPADTGRDDLKIVATINGEEITREQLAVECLRHYGSSVLEKVMNKYLIIQECQARGVTVTAEEVNQEIAEMAKRFSLDTNTWLKMLKDERGVNPEQYRNDIIWPTLALKKLAGERLRVSDAELREEYEALFGPAVKARLIVCEDAKAAQKVRAEAAAKPDDFGKLARATSVDYPSASANGLIQPIRRHLGPKEIEDVAFAMQPGEISQPIAVGNQYVILKCEEQIAARPMIFEQVKVRLEESVRERKMRTVATDVFQELQKKSQVDNIFDDPVKSRQMPGVAALINGHRVENRELAEMCIARHGEEVLEGMINRRLIEQACKQQKVNVAAGDIDQEIARAASLFVKPKADGTSDTQTWLELVTEQQNVSADVYRSDAVWPTVALKKLVTNQFQVTDEDLQKGFEANFGPRVRCRAIVFDDLKRAQQVWEMARKDPTVENFGNLAEQYSIEASSRSLRGEVPPIQKHGGQPILEKEAFALKPGELSSIVQVGRAQFVILLCESWTEPTKGVEFKDVRDEIYRDVFEKKQRLAMADHFQKLQDLAKIDNYLAGKAQGPIRTTSRPEAGPAVNPVRTQ